jgi:hypothetical protein
LAASDRCIQVSFDLTSQNIHHVSIRHFGAVKNFELWHFDRLSAAHFDRLTSASSVRRISTGSLRQAQCGAFRQAHFGKLSAAHCKIVNAE